jgi:hypothetical protein
MGRFTNRPYSASQTLKEPKPVEKPPALPVRGPGGREDAFSDRRFPRTAVLGISPAQGFKTLQALWYGIESQPVEGFADCAAQSRGWSRETS